MRFRFAFAARRRPVGCACNRSPGRLGANRAAQSARGAQGRRHRRGVRRRHLHRPGEGLLPVKDLSLLAKIAPTGFDPNGRMELKSLEADQDWYLKLGLQQGRADLGKVIDYQYLDYAISRLGKR